MKIQPKVCAVCGQVCDRYEGKWVHTAEVVGKGDHVCIPVDYNAVELVTRCDFCHRTVELKDRWVVVADDFRVPLIGSVSVGGWACDEPCARIAQRTAWDEMIERHLTSPNSQTEDAPLYRMFLVQLYAELERHMHEVRPFRAGDEMIPAEPVVPS